MQPTLVHSLSLKFKKVNLLFNFSKQVQASIHFSDRNSEMHQIVHKVSFELHHPFLQSISKAFFFMILRMVKGIKWSIFVLLWAQKPK